MIKKFFISLYKHISFYGLLLAALMIALGVFNSNTSLNPKIKQLQQEREIQNSFNEWWESEGALKFKNVGLEPTQKLKDEEFEQYREKYLATYHTHIVEDRIEEMKVEFRDWWENKGGKEEYADQHGIYPDETHYKAELKKWILKYTDKFIRYKWSFVPERSNYDALLTCWLLEPSIWSYLLFVIFFPFAFFQLIKRWNFFTIFGFFFLLAITGGFFTSLLTDTSFFKQFASSNYMGTSVPLVFLLGAASFGYNKEPIPKKVANLAFFGLLLSMAIDWFLNPGIFNAVAVESPVIFALGAWAGLKIPTHQNKVKKPQMQQSVHRDPDYNPTLDRKEKTRQLIDKGFSAAQNGKNEDAQRLLTQAMSNLLQERPIDTQDVVVLTERLTNPNFYITIPSIQWIEWGQTANSRNTPEAALKLFKKGISCEKDKIIIRRITFVICEIQIKNKIDIEEGLLGLDQLIKEKDGDIVAIQAKKIIQQIEEQNKAEFQKSMNKIMDDRP